MKQGAGRAGGSVPAAFASSRCSETPWLMEHLLPPPMTAASAQGTSSFPADRNPLPPWTSKEKGILKQNVWQSNSFQVYWGLYFYISLFDKFNIPQSGHKRPLQPQDFISISGGGWVCPLLWQCPWCVGDCAGEAAQQQESSFNKMKDGQSTLRKQQEKKIPWCIFYFYSFQPFMACQRYQTELPSKRLSCISFPRLKRFIHKLCTNSHPNPCDWSGINDISLHSLFCGC